MPLPHAPGDFAAWFEAYLDGRWYTFDPRNNVPSVSAGSFWHARPRCGGCGDHDDIRTKYAEEVFAFGRMRYAGSRLKTADRLIWMACSASAARKIRACTQFRFSRHSTFLQVGAYALTEPFAFERDLAPEAPAQLGNVAGRKRLVRAVFSGTDWS